MTSIQYHDEEHKKRRDYMRDWSARNKEKVKEWSRLWRDANKEKKRASNSVWRDANRERHRENSRRWVENNPVRYREIQKLASRKRRAIKAGLSEHHTEEQWNDLLNKYGNCCIACGATGKLEADHVVPIALGGTNDIANIQPLCRSCNARKWVIEHDWRI